MRTLTYSLLLCLLSTNALAQGERATVTGTVSDPTGAMVPAVAITIRNLETNANSRATTNSAGLFYIPALSPGVYDVNAEKIGFRPSRVSNLRLTVGLTATVAITLEPKPLRPGHPITNEAYPPPPKRNKNTLAFYETRLSIDLRSTA